MKVSFKSKGEKRTSFPQTYEKQKNSSAAISFYREIVKKTFYIVSKRIKYLGKNLPKDVKDL